MAEPSGPARLWYQSFVHPVEQAPYIKRLQALLDALRQRPASDLRSTGSTHPTTTSIR